MVREVTVGQPLLRVQNILGEGCVWDQQRQRLYWVDIEAGRIYSYEPSSETYGYETFAAKISSLALRTQGEGLVGTSESAFISIPDTSLPFPPTNSNSPQPFHVISQDINLLTPGALRFNDGFCDPAGRFLSGTMGTKGSGSRDGVLYSISQPEQSDASPLNRTYVPQKLLDGICVTNGTGWNRQGTKMFFTDSWIHTIFSYDYDLKTGAVSNRQIFHKSTDPELGEPDGLCVDDQDGIWSARWQAGKIVRISPQGEIDVVVHFPGALNITCCCWGGPHMDELYVTSATNTLMNQPHETHPQGGDLFVVKGLGFKGSEKHRFRD